MAKWTGYWEIIYVHPKLGKRREVVKRDTHAGATSEGALTLRGQNPTLPCRLEDGWKLDDVRPVDKGHYSAYCKALREDERAAQKEGKRG